jgi:predicted PurR-regulated permease PerM
MTNVPISRDITRTILEVLFIGVLLAATIWIMRPFLLALIWATMIVVASWPIMLRLEAWLGGKRSLAMAIMTVALLVVFIVPFFLAFQTILNHGDQIVSWVKGLATYSLPPPPVWVAKLPVVGPRLNEAWQQITSAGPGGLRARLAPYSGEIVKWFVERAGSLAMMFVQFLLTVIIAAVLFYSGEKVARAMRLFALRLGGERGEDAAILAAKTIRGVALGIVLTALIQAIVAGIGFAVSGVPAPVLLAAVIFILAMAQLPSFLVMGPAVIWLYWRGDPVWGTVLLVWTIVVSGIDNIVRPLLIRKGVDLPLLLILTGVIGGLIAFGILGLFIGPVVLAVTYRLLEEWVVSEAREPAPDSSGKPRENPPG